MFRPIMGSVHGPNQSFSQPVNREVFPFTSAESIGASRLRGPNRLPHSNWKVGSIDLVTLVIFNLTVCDLRFVTGKCHTLNY